MSTIRSIMVVGSDKVYAIENYYVRYMREAGFAVEHFLAQGMFYDYYQSSLWNKVLFKFGLSSIIQKINTLFLEQVRKVKPDVVFVFKGMELYPQTILKLKELGIVVVNYNPDNPFIFSGKGSGNQNISKSLALYDAHFTYNLEIQKQLEQVQSAKVFYLPFGFEIDEKVYKLAENQVEVNKLCFLGNPDEKRAGFILKLAERGVLIDVYGNGWSKFANHDNISVFPPVYGDDLWKSLRRYRIQLNLMRIHNEDSHNMRSFEVPAIGGIMLAPNTTEHRLFFDDGKNVFLYDNLEDCISKIDFILGLSAGAAIGIREAARKKSIESGYSYKDRTNWVLQKISTFSLG